MTDSPNPTDPPDPIDGLGDDTDAGVDEVLHAAQAKMVDVIGALTEALGTVPPIVVA